jgi:hypothetical protein
MKADTENQKKPPDKMRAASPTQSGELSRDVYLAGCQAIANAMREYGYVYTKSGPKLRRKSQDFIFQVDFQSSHHNVSGKLIALWIHGNVFSAALKQWRAVNPCLLKTSDYVAGGQIGNLLALQSWMEWNLALPAERFNQIEAAVASIRDIILPYFAMFDDLPLLRQRLVLEEIPSFSPACALDFLRCFGSKNEAIQAASQMLHRLPGAQDQYASILATYRNQGLPSYTPTAHGEVLALATILYDFPDLSQKAG